jgi:hypothetical protein
MTEKLSRNDPCSCGSGKKYKKCCFQKEQSVSVEQAEVPKESNSSLEVKNRLEERVKIKVTKTPFKGPPANTKLPFRNKSGRGK